MSVKVLLHDDDGFLALYARATHNTYQLSILSSFNFGGKGAVKLAPAFAIPFLPQLTVFTQPSASA